jgi:hypothetical protein
MAECKPEKTIRRHGGEVWSCRCGTVGVTFNGVTIRYSPRDFKKLAKLMQIASAQLLENPVEPAAPSTDGGSLH